MGSIPQLSVVRGPSHHLPRVSRLSRIFEENALKTPNSTAIIYKGRLHCSLVFIIYTIHKPYELDLLIVSMLLPRNCHEAAISPGLPLRACRKTLNRHGRLRNNCKPADLKNFRLISYIAINYYYYYCNFSKKC